MTNSEILAHVDHTLLKADASWQQLQTLCDEAVAYQTASICINSGRVKQAVDYLSGRIPVCTVIGFPLGAASTQSKVLEAEQAEQDGAAEFDMVINIGRLKDGDAAFVQRDIEAVRRATPGRVLKVIIETCLLTEEEKKNMCEIVCNSGADYIKTSTGFSTAGATFADIELFTRAVRGRVKIKAAGGIRTVDDMIRYIQMGADRLGTSSAIRLLNEMQAQDY